MHLQPSMSCKTCGYVSACISVFQTPGLWIDEGVEQGSPHQRSASWGSADHLKEVDSPTLTSFSAKSQLLLTTNTADGGLTKGAASALWLTLSYSRPDRFKTLTGSSKRRFLSFLRSVRFTQNVFYLSGSEVSLNIMLLNVGFHSCLSAGLGGQPADHMELLVLQLSRPQSKFKLLLPLLFPTQLHPCISLWPVVFERQCRSSSQGGSSHIVALSELMFLKSFADAPVTQ